MLLGEWQLVLYRGASFQLANLSQKASWKLTPRANPYLPLALSDFRHEM